LPMRVFVITREAIVRASMIAALALASVVFLLYMDGGDAPAAAPKDNIPIYSVKTAGSQVALTFDAAWGCDRTLKLLDVFDTYHIKVTFFVTGMWADANPTMLKEISDRGHEIGNHSYTHKDFATLSDADMVKELDRASDAIESVTGRKPTLFRAPYGSWNARIVDVVCGQQYDFIQWDVDSLDWKGLTPDAIEARVLPKVQSGSIVLFHNDGQHTPEAIGSIIEKLQAKGYQFVTVSELVGESLEARKK
jgi:polysaccharide deacetylase family sporulation protein PdaB